MKTVNILLGADLRGGHNSLTIQAKERKVIISELKKDEAIIFINRKKDKMKCYAYNGVLSYVRFDDPRRGIDLNALDYFPQAFRSDGTMDYPRALRESLKKRIGDKKFKELEVL